MEELGIEGEMVPSGQILSDLSLCGKRRVPVGASKVKGPEKKSWLMGLRAVLPTRELWDGALVQASVLGLDCPKNGSKDV